ncbi:MAG: cytochrome c [Chitinophagaceae bacterium]|nr:MAG: cytochrome c [Chitinophagaceae bacterium]
MNQVRYLFLAIFILLAGWSLYWIGEQVFLTEQRSAALTSVKTAAASTATPGTAAKATPPPAPGKGIFQQNCAACHALDKDMTGPALRGLTSRGPWADRKKLYAWVHNPAAFLAKDPYTQGLQKQYGAIMMPFPQLTEKDIDQIVEYVEAK